MKKHQFHQSKAHWLRGPQTGEAPLRGEAAKLHKMLHDLRAQGMIDPGEGIEMIASIPPAAALAARWRRPRGKKRA